MRIWNGIYYLLSIDLNYEITPDMDAYEIFYAMNYDADRS